MISFLLAAAYCVVDLSAGSQAKFYPVSYLEKEPVGGWGDAHRLDKLVLRRIEAKEPYYIGVFEVTQRQYGRVTGRNPSCFKGAMRPVECVTWETVRGSFADHAWPKTTEVDGSRFVGRLRVRTGLAFDLPSEAQWEFAATVGGMTPTGGGRGVDGANGQEARSPMNASGVQNGWGRYAGNRGDGKGGFAEHTKVGSYAPNGWGLYDMLGNVWEWCLDGKKGVDLLQLESFVFSAGDVAGIFPNRTDDLRGPYRPTGRRSITPPEWNALDGTLWVEDGKPYMVFCHEWTRIDASSRFGII